MGNVNLSIRPSHRDVNIKTIRPLAACSRLVVWKNQLTHRTLARWESF